MLSPPLSLLALCLATSPAFAATAGSFADGGNTLVSAMMMFIGNIEKVYILDKAEGNAQQVNGHSAWGSVWDMNTHQAQVMDVRTNVFCSSGMHLPNGSYIALGGNGAVGRGGNAGSQFPPGAPSATWDTEYQDFDGGKSIRILNPCSSSDDFSDPKCQWFDEPELLAMKKRRWYSAAEALADGSVVIIGGFVNGGYINRNVPNNDPLLEGGAAEPTFEFYPPRDGDAQIMQFMVKSSGLNAYAHSYLMPSGHLFVQANVSTILWDYNANTEVDLPGMPHNVARVYPASGAVAMLPLTPQNNYTPTIIFCGGSDMPESAYGDYAHPAINTWNYPASKDCQRITPEPQDGSPPTYQQDDDMLEGRTMGQFIILPDGKLLVVNGGLNGTAGYAQATGETANFGDMPWGESLASGPVGTPAIYDPNAPAGKRWTNQGLATSNIARLYHSSAILLPDASVLIAGSNPNVDVNTSTIFPTTYQAEIFYPPYFSASTRPNPSGVPKTLSYGGQPFDLTVPPSSYSGSANDAADKTKVVVTRGGFTTHAMNMGQRYLQLNNTYTVNSDGSITLHVSQMPPNANIFQPGPALMFVTIDGIPSNGTYLIVGNGQMGIQPVSAVSALPNSVRLDSASGSAGDSGGSGSGSGNNNSTSSNGASSHTGAIVGGIVGAIAVIGIVGAVIGIYLARRNRAMDREAPSAAYMKGIGGAEALGGAAGVAGPRAMRSSDSSAFLPLQQDNHSNAWNASTTSLTAPYRDDDMTHARTGSATGMSMEYDPYASIPMQNNPTPHRY